MKLRNLAALLLSSTVLFSTSVKAAEPLNNPDSKWMVMLGVGAATVPEYIGAEDHEFLVLPAVVVDYEFHEKNHLFINTFKGAGYEYRGERVFWGVKGGWRRGRDDNDSELLEGMGDLDDTATAGFHAGLNFGPFSLMAEYDAGLDNNNDGVLTTFSAKYKMRSVERPMSGYIKAKAVYGDDAYHDAYFGVSDAVATPTRPEYEAEAAFVGVGLNAGIDYLLADHHYFRLDAGYMSLSNDVTNSPIVEEDHQYNAAVSYGYKF